MKEYNREKRIWVEVDKNTSLKKSKLCKENKPHNFVLVLPDYLRTLGNISLENVEEYYKSEERLYEFRKKEYQILKDLGIIINTWNSKSSRYYKCERCGKKDYKSNPQ